MRARERGQLIIVLAAGAILLSCFKQGDAAFICVIVAAFLLLTSDD